MKAVLLHSAGWLVAGIVVSGSVLLANSGQTAATDQRVTTIVGCLVQGGAGNGGPAKAKTTDFFVRTPTVAVPVGATVAVGKPGTASTATSAGTPAPDSYYRITGMTGDKLRGHLGHRVELQGHLSAAKADAAAAGITSTKTTVDAAGKPKVTVETRVDVAGDLHATALKMVSAKCE